MELEEISIEQAVKIADDPEDGRKVFRLVECYPWDTVRELNATAAFYVDAEKESK